MKPIKPGRIPCAVVGCGRTASKEWAGRDTEIICGKHFRSVPLALRDRYSKACRLAKRIEARLVARQEKFGGVTDGELRQLEAAFDLAFCIWTKIKTRAIEIAMGIST